MGLELFGRRDRRRGHGERQAPMATGIMKELEERRPRPLKGLGKKRKPILGEMMEHFSVC